ncbi:Uncharacterised protein [uncultured archaeon]|nr:Uncharacterised protein [uncultured archaeon]
MANVFAAISAKFCRFDPAIDTLGTVSPGAASKLIGKLAEEAKFSPEPLRTESLKQLEGISGARMIHMEKPPIDDGIRVVFSKSGTDVLPHGIHLRFGKKSASEAKKALNNTPRQGNPVAMKA